MDAVANLPPHKQQEFMQYMEEMQLKDSLSMYNRLVEKCSHGCLTTFRSKTLDKYETTCLVRNRKPAIQLLLFAFGIDSKLVLPSHFTISLDAPWNGRKIVPVDTSK